MRSSIRALVLAFLFACLYAIPTTTLAQTTSGQISGRVVDPAGAAVVNAVVTLTNQLTGDQHTVNSLASGEFVFVGIQPGAFSVAVEATGFKRFEKRDLQLSAAQRLSAGNLKLQIGAVTQEVSVTAEPTPVQTESAERSALLDDKELSSLMTIGRDPLGLLRVLPGVVRDGGGNSSLGTESAGTVAGVRESSNAVSIDGVLGNPRGDGNKLDTPLVMDAVGEVKVLLNSYQAEYGQSSGAIINLTTKSGGRQFHGTGYYYGRNEAFNANSFLNNRRGDPRGIYRYNVYGFTIGGPAYIPKLFNTRKDKLFFFFAMERWPIKTDSGLQRYMMPTAAERNGDFSNSYDAKGQKIYVRDPDLNAPCSASDQSGCFPGNIIPQDRINANTQKLLNIFNLPTIDCTPFGQGGQAACPLTNVTSGTPYNYTIDAPKAQPAHEYVLRVDYNLTNKWRMFFRGLKMFKENSGLTATVNKTQWGIPSYYSTPGRNAGINLTYTASASLVNEFTVGYSDWDEQQGFTQSSDLDLLSRSSLGIMLGQNNADQNPLDLVPRITNLSSGGSNGTYQLAGAPSIDFDNRFPMNNSTGTWEFTDSLTKIWRTHTAKAGIYFQSSRYIQRHIGSTFNGKFVFGANSSSPYDTQYAYSNMLLGSYGSYSEGSNVVDYAPHWNILEWYLQDSWKARPNLTIDYGVRFTYDLPTTLKPGMGASFVTDRYDPSQVPSLFMPVTYSSLDAAGQSACKGLSRSTPSRCAQDPNNLANVQPDTFIGTFVDPFDYTGTVINTDPTFPHSLRYSNGLLAAPRLGIAWDPFHDGKTAIRAGAGIYYNAREGGGTVGDYSLIAPLVTNASVSFGQITGSNFAPDCGATNSCYGAGSQVNAGPLDSRILEPHRGIESTIAANFGVQRYVGFGTVVDVAYVGTFGRHLNQQVNLNEIPYLAHFDPQFVDPSQSSQNCFFYAPHHDGTTLCQPKLLSDNYFRPYPGYGNINIRDYGATSNYNALQTSVNRRFARGLQFGVSYTWSKTLTTQGTVDGAVAVYQNRHFWNYGLADFDRTHDLVFHWLANVPRASRLWDNGFMRAIGDNWQWSGIAEFVSGHPMAVTMSGTPDLTGGGDGARVLVVGDVYAPKGQIHNTLQYLNKDAFMMPDVGVIPSPDQPGMTGAIIFRGPGTNNWDMALQKDFPIREKMAFSLRLEAYNAFNHPSFTMSTKSGAAPTTANFDTSTKCTGAAANDPVCGSGLIKSNSTFGQIDGERSPRILQVSARFTF